MAWLEAVVAVADLGLSWFSDRYHRKPRQWHGFRVDLETDKREPNSPKPPADLDNRPK